VATRNLPLGCSVLTEQPVLVVVAKKPEPDKLLADYLSKSKETQREILNLYDIHEVDEDLSNEKNLVSKLVGIVETNSIVCKLGKEATKNVYLKASLLNHDCRPNLTWHPLNTYEGTIVVKVLRTVVKGEELTVSYIRDETCLTRIQRKEKLEAYMFECKCNICKEEDTADEEMRKEFQELNKKSFEIGNSVKLLKIAERKLKIAKIVDAQAVFRCLVECWKLYESISAVDRDDQVVADKASQYKKEAGMFANILGPASVQAFFQLERAEFV